MFTLKLKAICFSVLLCVLSFSSLSHGSMELSIHGGWNYHVSDLQLSGINATWVDQKAHSFEMGGDLLYRLPMNDLAGAVGVRYRHQNTFMGKTPVDSSGNDVTTSQEFKFNANRFALLGNYRIINSTDGLLIGLVLAVDVFRMMKYTETGGASDVEISRNQFWLPGVQAGIELGYKFNPNLFLKAEVGFTYNEFNKLECATGCTGSTNTGDNKLTNEDAKLSLNAVYATLGIGYFLG